MIILVGVGVFSTEFEERSIVINLIVVSEDYKGIPSEKRMTLLQESWKHKVPLEAFVFIPLTKLSCSDVEV